MTRLLAFKLSTGSLDFENWITLLRPLELGVDEAFLAGAVSDLSTCVQRDIAVKTVLQPFLFFKGFHALQAQRASHWLWKRGTHQSQLAALLIQSRASEMFAVDLHPGAKLGCGILLDHGTGVVIGETATVGNGVTILHGVTLGATGRPLPTPDAIRHPTIGDNVSIGASAVILGNITIGDGATIGASAVVTKSVGSGKTVIGVNKVLALDVAVHDDVALYSDDALYSPYAKREYHVLGSGMHI